MNWTAILALLAVNVILAWLLWFAEERAQAARADASDWQQLRANAELKAQRLESDLVLARSLARRRQSRTGQRAGETDNG